MKSTKLSTGVLDWARQSFHQLRKSTSASSPSSLSRPRIVPEYHCSSLVLPRAWASITAHRTPASLRRCMVRNRRLDLPIWRLLNTKQ